MRTNRFLALGMAGAVFLSVGCGSPRRGEPITGPYAWQAPSATVNHLLDTGGIKRGELVFARYCHQCHPGGEGGLGPALNNKPAPVWLMKTQVRAGLGAMPDFDEAEISGEELDDLMAYVIALRKEG